MSAVSRMRACGWATEHELSLAPSSSTTSSSHVHNIFRNFLFFLFSFAIYIKYIEFRANNNKQHKCYKFTASFGKNGMENVCWNFVYKKYFLGYGNLFWHQEISVCECFFFFFWLANDKHFASNIIYKIARTHTNHFSNSFRTDDNRTMNRWPKW